jgi:hypothetical protein
VTILALVCIFSQVNHRVGKPTVRLANDRFVISVGRNSEEVRFDKLDRAAPDHILFRSDQTFAAWDKRGLTVRSGRRTLTTQLKEIPVSPRLRSRQSIRATLDEVKTNDRSLDASAISGARRVGKTVYFVARWEDGPGETWLEALVEVNLASSKPEPHALAILPGESFSKGLISDNLIGGAAGLRILLHTGANWGVWDYPLDGTSPTFKPVGEGIKYAAPFAAERACYVEKTKNGAFVAGTVDLDTGVRSDTDESNSPWHMAELGDPPLAEKDNKDRGRDLLNVTSGADLTLAPDCDFRRCKAGVLVWAGGKHPTKAWLYDPTDWSPIAWWRPASVARHSTE